MVTAPAPDDRASLIKLVAVTFAVVAVLVAASVRLLDVELPFVGHLGSAVVAVVLLYAPVYLAWRRREDLVDYGFTTHPRGKSIAISVGYILLVGPLFAVGYVLFYSEVCRPGSPFGELGLPGACAGFEGFAGMHAPALDLELLEYAAIQLVVVALPEELFFRGFCHELLERAIPPKRRLWGGGIGWALVLSSLLFALIHLPKDGDPRALATFFPGLAFGWMRSATGSIVASTVTHASSNMFVKLVERMV